MHIYCIYSFSLPDLSRYHAPRIPPMLLRVNENDPLLNVHRDYLRPKKHTK